MSIIEVSSDSDKLISEELLLSPLLEGSRDRLLLLSRLLDLGLGLDTDRCRLPSLLLEATDRSLSDLDTSASSVSVSYILRHASFLLSARPSRVTEACSFLMFSETAVSRRSKSVRSFAKLLKFASRHDTVEVDAIGDDLLPLPFLRRQPAEETSIVATKDCRNRKK